MIFDFQMIKHSTHYKMKPIRVRFHGDLNKYIRKHSRVLAHSMTNEIRLQFNVNSMINSMDVFTFILFPISMCAIFLSH